MGFTLADIRQHDCVQKAYAGAVIGTVCGFCFGAMDAANASGIVSDPSFAAIRQKLRSPTIMRFYFRHHLGVTGMFGLMYTTYQSAKCGIEVYAGPDVVSYIVEHQAMKRMLYSVRVCDP